MSGLTPSSKALLLIVAIAALSVGVVIGSADIDPVTEASPVLTAKLIQVDDEFNEINGQSPSKDLKKLTLINFWASWCAPCRKEMPVFQTMVDVYANQGFQVVGIAIDTPDKTRSMLDSMGIRYPIYYAEQTGMLLMEKVGNAEGFLPYSVLVDSNGKVLEQKLGTVHEGDIVTWVEQYLP